MRIYIGRDGKRYGPLSLDELNAHLESGRVQQGDLAWFDGAAGWGPISSIPGARLPTLDVSSRSPPVASRDSNAKKVSGHSSPPSSDPSLWNPNAAVNWSILFGVPLGAFLHARNWRAMGEHRKEKVALVWFWATAALEAICILLDIGGKVYGGIWLWSLILWYFTSARAQTNYIQQTYGSTYPRNGFVKPLLIALACYFGAALVSVGIQTVITHDPATGMASTSAERERVPVPPRPASNPVPQASTRSSEQKAVVNVPATVRVERLALGPSVNTSQQVVGETVTFSPEQTIYASVSTAGAALAATMSVKWFYRETEDLVNASSQVIAPNGPTITSFHISKPDGWPIGRYQVQIYLDNVLAAQQDFNVLPQRLSETAADKTVVGKCLLEVSGRRYIDGRCPIRMSSDGGFAIGASESEPLTYFAIVSILGRDVADGHWNEESGASHAHTPLGTLRRTGACWENSAAKVCAERLADQAVPPSSSVGQAAAPYQSGGVRFTDADLKALECSTTFEQERWSSAENEHGLTMTATDGEKLYIGKSCDVISSRFGNGRWAWANGGVRFQFESCFIGWPHAEPPIEDNDCEWAN